ncbi:S1 family peptidase [Vibrio vulnificus]|uniref:S1 family peptidase n=1 Tax=Vibrio vulnificus TaxID=672 RepID=UPI000504D31E|nr:serine protease [Vibrio vulnificus]ASJ39091.1 hypothetical protein VVCECT4999_10395 [Vibrio vulnificus]EGR0393153.1 trypsin-like peptidase domain-containing protein [Vibrio vulnificus]EGR0642100.1 serine protease [Vibrio vulnificus]EHU9473382.1 trypsin-like peptidase domain-containing protein [Vibrio vulnificus]EID4444614.1 trypsin-like peptidase domain-containing protein [Vibrio vulnificus]
MNLDNSVFHVKCGDQEGTAFLVSKNTALTAFHVVEEYFDGRKITLSNSSNVGVEAKVSSVTVDKYKAMDIAILNVSELDDNTDYLPVAISETIPEMTKWSSRGYLGAKTSDGHNINPVGNTIVTSYYESLTEERSNYDTDLAVEGSWTCFEGMSGSPLIIDGYVYGVLTTETIQNGSTKELCALSTSKFSELLNQAEINFATRNIDCNKELDNSGTEGYDGIIVEDSRSLSEKLTSVCSDIRKSRIHKYGRDAINSNLELARFPDCQVNSLKYRIFEACQSKLLDLVEDGLEPSLDIHQVKNILDQFVEEAHKVISERSSDYTYPVGNKDSIRKAILALIDECYLSFDEEGLYE